MFHKLIYKHARKEKVEFDYEVYYNWCETCKGEDYNPRNTLTLDKALENFAVVLSEVLYIEKFYSWLGDRLWRMAFGFIYHVEPFYIVVPFGNDFPHTVQFTTYELAEEFVEQEAKLKPQFGKPSILVIVNKRGG